MSGHEQDTDISDSTPGSNGPEGAAGDMGVSSERVGPAGPGQVGTDGLRDTGITDRFDEDVPPERAAGGDEANPDPPIPPVAGYSSHDPRSADQPFRTDGPRSEGGA